MDRVEKVALEIRRDRIARTTRTGGAFDPDVPPTESEIAEARARRQNHNRGGDHHIHRHRLGALAGPIGRYQGGD